MFLLVNIKSVNIYPKILQIDTKLIVHNETINIQFSRLRTDDLLSSVLVYNKFNLISLYKVFSHFLIFFLFRNAKTPPLLLLPPVCNNIFLCRVLSLTACHTNPMHSGKPHC